MKEQLYDEKAFSEKELEHLEQMYFNSKRLPEIKFNPKKSWSQKVMDWVVYGK